MKVRIKKLRKDAVIPAYAKDGDAGMDLTCTSRKWDVENNVWEYGTGLAFEIPKGYVGLIFPRSSIFKYDLSLSNAVGVVDSGYRGEVMAKFKETLTFEDDEILTRTGDGSVYGIGERICQIIIIPIPEIEFEEVVDLTETERGIGGYGSSGN